MSGMGRRRVAVGLGAVAIATGVGLEIALWRVAPVVLGMAMQMGSQPNARSWFNLIDLTFVTNALGTAGLFLIGFGLCVELIALHHWVWNGTLGPDGDGETPPKPPQFVDNG